MKNKYQKIIDINEIFCNPFMNISGKLTLTIIYLLGKYETVNRMY